jgi:hypothetical protein
MTGSAQDPQQCLSLPIHLVGSRDFLGLAKIEDQDPMVFKRLSEVDLLEMKYRIGVESEPTTYLSDGYS